MEPKIVIIGAGPTGLGAGYRLKELGYKNFQIYDRLPYIGGLASSFTDSAVISATSIVVGGLACTRLSLPTTPSRSSRTFLRSVA